MPEPCSYISTIVSCKVNRVGHSQRWAGGVLGESGGVLGGWVSGGAAHPPGSLFSLSISQLREKSGRVWSGPSCSSGELSAARQRRRVDISRAPSSPGLLRAPLNTPPSQRHVRPRAKNRT